MTIYADDIITNNYATIYINRAKENRFLEVSRVDN